MKKLLSIALILTLSIGLLVSCGTSGNTFMQKGSKDYKKVTSIVVGHSDITHFNGLMEAKYENAIANFDFATKAFSFEIFVKKSFLANKLSDWEDKYPDLEIDEYKILVTGIWDISLDGTHLLFNELKTDIVINGSGENFEGFYVWEKAKYELAKSAGATSGLMGMAMGAMAKTLTGTTSLFPKIDNSYKLTILKDGKGFRLYGAKSKLTFKK